MTNRTSTEKRANVPLARKLVEPNSGRAEKTAPPERASTGGRRSGSMPNGAVTNPRQSGTLSRSSSTDSVEIPASRRKVPGRSRNTDASPDITGNSTSSTRQLRANVRNAMPTSNTNAKSAVGSAPASSASPASSRRASVRPDRSSDRSDSSILVSAPSTSSEDSRTSDSEWRSTSAMSAPATSTAPLKKRVTPNKPSWDGLRQSVFAGTRPPAHYQKQAVRDLQNELDPRLEIPLIVTGVEFDAAGKLKSISVVRESDTKAITKEHAKLDRSERDIGKGNLQLLAIRQKARTKSVPMQDGNLKAAWKNSRLGNLAKTRGQTAVQLAGAIEQAARTSMQKLNANLNANLVPLLETISTSFLVNDTLKVEGLFRVSGSQSDLTTALLAAQGGPAIAAGLLKASDANNARTLADMVKTLMRERSHKVLSCDDVRDLNGKIAGMTPDDAKKAVRQLLQMLPPEELAVWKAAISLYQRVASHSGSNLMSSSSLAIVTWQGLFRSDNPLDLPTDLMQHLIDNAQVHFGQLPTGINPTRSAPAHEAWLSDARLDDSWKPMLSALNDARDAFTFLAQRLTMTYTGNNVPMRQIFQKGKVPDAVDVPASFHTAYKKGQFLEFFGRYVNLIPNEATSTLMNMIDVALLHACDDLRRMMSGKFNARERAMLLEAIAKGQAKDVSSLLHKKLTRAELRHLEAFFAASAGILDAIEAKTAAGDKDQLPRAAMASNFYNAIIALTGSNSNQLSRAWARQFPDQGEKAAVMYAKATKDAARNLVMNPQAYFGR